MNNLDLRQHMKHGAMKHYTWLYSELNPRTRPPTFVARGTQIKDIKKRCTKNDLVPGHGEKR